jgi:hypothetical protein
MEPVVPEEFMRIALADAAVSSLEDGPCLDRRDLRLAAITNPAG